MFNIANNTEFLEAIGIKDAPDDVKTTLIAGIETLAQKKLVSRLSSIITDEQAEQFGNIKDEQESYDWLMANIPNFQQIVEETLAEIRDDILKHRAVVVG